MYKSKYLKSRLEYIINKNNSNLQLKIFNQKSYKEAVSYWNSIKESYALKASPQ